MSKLILPLYMAFGSLLLLESVKPTQESQQFTVQIGGQQIPNTRVSLYLPYTLLIKTYNSSQSPTYSSQHQINLTEPLISGTLGQESILISNEILKIPVISDLSSFPPEYDCDAVLSFAFEASSLLSQLKPAQIFIHLQNTSEYLVSLQGTPEPLPQSSCALAVSTWELSINGLILGGVVDFSTSSARFDLHSEYILAPNAIVNSIFDYFLKKFSCGLTVSLSSLYCACEEPLPDLYIKVAGVQLVISKSDYQVGQECEVKISYSNSDRWELGQPFFRSYSLMLSQAEGKIEIFKSNEFDVADLEQGEEDTGLFSAGNLVVIGEIIVGCLVIFIIARMAYGYCMTVEFSPPEESQPFLSPRMNTPRGCISPRR